MDIQKRSKIGHPDIKRQYNSYLLLLTFCLFFVILSACGSDTSSYDEAAPLTGSIAFDITWQIPTNKSLTPKTRAKSPSGNVCVDYDIDTIDAYIYNDSNIIVTEGSWLCSAHEGIISDVPPGTGMRVEIEGSVAGKVNWRGQSLPISVQAGETTKAGTVTMKYCADDKISPRVESATPCKGAIGVKIETNIVVTFSENIVPASVNTSTFSLKSDTNQVVTGAVTYDPNNMTATFDPNSNLSYNTAYTTTITTNVEDKAGNTMPNNYIWTFITVPDTIPPHVISNEPNNEATKVPVTTAVTATFSEAMDPNSLKDAFVLRLADTDVPGDVTYTGTTATFQPLTALTYNALYTVIITRLVMDLAGNALVSDYTWTFRILDACEQSNGGIEACDSIDNDCDGEIDEGFNLQTDSNNCGMCGNICHYTNASSLCINGTCIMDICEDGYYDINSDPNDGCEYACTQSNGGAEDYDGKDNDCDGLVDEDCEPTTWYVGPGKDFQKIQDAINEASEEDTIIVTNGTYYENILLTKNNLTIQGEDPNTTIIDGDDIGITVYFNQADNTTIKGFSIQNGLRGILLDYSHQNTIDSCKIILNSGIGIHVRNSSSNNTFKNSKIAYNESNGIDLSDRNNQKDNTIINNIFK